jgi:MobA/VirD2-like, nuclease domain
MISKAIKAGSFYHTCRYVMQKPGAELLIAEGVRGYDYKLMADDFEIQQQLRPGKRKACFHAILSFYPGENPQDGRVKEIAARYLKELGVTGTQYAIVKHTDRSHLHLHLIANMVNNEGKSITDSWLGLRGKKISQQLTEEYQLIPANRKNLKLTHLEALNEKETEKYRVYMAISENLPKVKTIEELETKLQKQGIEIQYKYLGQTNQKQGISFSKGVYCFKGSQVDRQFSYNNLQKAMQLQRQNLSQGQEQNQQVQSIKDHYPSQNLAKETGKIIHNLLKPEQGSEGAPYGLIEEIKRRKKKKKQQQRIH